MAKNDLHVTIPPHFRCPISLELMQSPVALSTGITYDRSSIQAWLDAGNLTCPATMLPLPDAAFIPNLSLLRLIHLSSLHPPSPRHPHHNLSLLLHRFTSASSNKQPSFTDLSLHLSTLLDLAKDSEDNRSILANSDRFVSSLVRLTCGFDLDSGDVEFLELAVVALDLVSRESETCKEKIHKLFLKSDPNRLAPIARVLRVGSTDSRIAAAKFLHSISIDAETKREIAENRGLVADLFGLVTSDDDHSIEAGLSALISVTTTRAFKSELIRLGTVRTLGNILAGSNHLVSVIVKAMEMAELLATCGAGRTAICDDEKCLAEIVRKVMKVSEKATEFGVTVLWSVCHLFRNEKAVAVAVGNNGLTKCLLVMQSNCSAVVRQMCRDLVKVLRGDSVSLGLMSYDTKTTHIMPC